MNLKWRDDEHNSRSITRLEWRAKRRVKWSLFGPLFLQKVRHTDCGKAKASLGRKSKRAPFAPRGLIQFQERASAPTFIALSGPKKKQQLAVLEENRSTHTVKESSYIAHIYWY